MVILEELFTNAAKHGVDGEAELGSIEVSLAFEAGRLRIEFSDNGCPFDPLTDHLPNRDGSMQERPIGGFGLHILLSLVDDARYARDGERNRLVLFRAISRPD